MRKRVWASACLVLLLLSGCQSSDVSIDAKLSREFAVGQTSNVIAKSASEVVMKTGSRVDIPYHVKPGTVSGSDASNLNMNDTKISYLRPFVVTQSDVGQANIGDDIPLMDMFNQGARGLLNYTGKQQGLHDEVLNEVRTGYAPAVSVKDLDNMFKIVIPGNSIKYDEVAQAVQDFINSTNDPTVTIPVMQTFDKNNPNFIGFVKMKLKIVNGTLIRGTYEGWVGPTSFSVTNLKFQESFPAGLDVQTTDSHFTKTGTPKTGETVTATLPDIVFQKNMNGDYDGGNVDFTLTVIATNTSQPGTSYSLNNSTVTYLNLDNTWKTANFPSLTITVKDGLQDISIPSLIERNVGDPSAPIPITVTPASAASQLQLQYGVTQDQNFADVSIQNQNLIINPKNPGEMNVTVSVKDDFGDMVQKQAHVMLYQFISDSSFTLNEGETKTFPYTLLPSTIANMTWTMADTKIASASNSQITGNHAGQTLLTITGIGHTGTIFTKQITVTVKSTTIPLQALYFSPASVSMNIGDTLDASALLKFVPANATNQTITSWTSSNPDIAMVDSKGVVTAKKAGTISITAQAQGNLNAVLTITVNDPYKAAYDPNNPLYRW
ncbi:Ig-like domain-containing protein [Ectobacillus polymachus]|uniref:Ig-like domain-containing protein n=1 Tax=Ectobacillus polymachus TaxID=1508806 RepID=UPI003A89208D